MKDAVLTMANGASDSASAAQASASASAESASAASASAEAAAQSASEAAASADGILIKDTTNSVDYIAKLRLVDGKTVIEYVEI